MAATTEDHVELGEAAQRGELATALRSAAPGSWEHGWVLAALGRYGEALDILGPLATGDGDQAALALGTRASLLRQLALHDRAERDDTAGLCLAADPAVHASLLVGAVADSLGLAHGITEWNRRLAAATITVGQHGDWRQRVRLSWVSGEVAMYDGRPADAVPFFAEAVAAAEARGARRHAAKSRLFAGAAQAALGHGEAAHDHAAAALRLATTCGAQPLVWAAALVLAETGARDRLELARTTLRGILDGLPTDLRLAALTRPPADWLLAAPGRAGQAGGS